MASVLIQFLCTLLMYLALQSSHELPTEQNSCYPKGSVACKMWNSTNMDCSWRDLVCIPPLRHAASINSLDLKENKLTAIPDDAFRSLKKLQLLDLSHNDISTLHKGAFTGQLQLLDLSNNEISTLHNGVFTGLDKLLTLRLSYNHVSQIQANVFSSLRKLKHLDLSSNRISALHIGAFTGLHDLLSLELRDNLISSISDKTFSTLGKLTSLDLGFGNYLQTLEGVPFRNLISLQSMVIDWQNVTSLSTSSLVGLENLQILIMSFNDRPDNITGTPLALLSSLRELHIVSAIYDCDNIGNLFIGLHNLQHLHIIVGGSCPEIKFCSSYKEYSHHLHTGHECSRVIPLSYLEFHQKSLTTTSFPDFEILNNLTSLFLDLSVDIHTAIEGLNSLDSPLQNLTLEILNKAVNLSSTTFASWGNWKASLQKLKLSVERFGEFQGAPFEWFKELKVLSLHSSLDTRPPLTLSVNIFKGLIHLNKLEFRNVHIDLPSFGALNIFSSYESLTNLDLSYNQLGGTFEFIWEQLCNISSLEKIDVAFNALYGNQLWSCSPPNLKKLSIGYQNPDYPMFDDWFSAHICQVAPHLESFDASAVHIDFHQTNSTCPFLETLGLDACQFADYNEYTEMQLPVLQKLYLNNIVYYQSDLAGLLNIFKAPILQNLYLNSNEIDHIDNKLVMYYNSLTFLDLSNNKLVSVSNFQHFKNIRHLTHLDLSNNRIPIIPKEILHKTQPAQMDFSSNPFQCDCNVKAFRKWILTDTMVQLSGIEKYTCFLPDSEKDLSFTQVNIDCAFHVWKYITIGITCALVLIVSVILIVRYWWHIKYRLFLVFNRRRNQQHHLIEMMNVWMMMRMVSLFMMPMFPTMKKVLIGCMESFYPISSKEGNLSGFS
ncbi:toll-like receptor 8 [Amphiura filiformis]|uniref:toll-like receptor 8 n=1 Tax=Amphiura filiformis TaxID=82378 RepID=UPI003B223349